jgi:glycerate 2-kinase
VNVRQPYNHTTTTLNNNSEQQHVLSIFQSAIKAVHPERLMADVLSADEQDIRIADNLLPKKEIHRFIVIAAGKAAAAMSQAAEKQLGNAITEGICITKYHHALPLQYLSTIEAAHPVPDENSLMAGVKVLQLVKDLTAKDVVLVLLSGGASALMADAPDGCSLQDVQSVFDLLLKSGATIAEMNAVRKHVSAIKGGQLARHAQPAKVFTLVLSDVVGDDAATIGSGPTAIDHSTFEDVYAILTKYAVWANIPASVQHHIQKGMKGLVKETLKPEPNDLKQQNLHMIGNNKMALMAAAEKSRQLGYHTIIDNDKVQEDAFLFAEVIVRTYEQYSGRRPACILFGGETTVKVTGNGKGGRNQHLTLLVQQLLLKHKPQSRIIFLSAGTDGTDGATDAAGAIADSAGKKLTETEIKIHLSNFDAYHFFKQNGGLITTGATQTNVMDVMMLLIL